MLLYMSRQFVLVCSCLLAVACFTLALRCIVLSTDTCLYGGEAPQRAVLPYLLVLVKPVCSVHSFCLRVRACAVFQLFSILYQADPAERHVCQVLLAAEAQLIVVQ